MPPKDGGKTTGGGSEANNGSGGGGRGGGSGGKGRGRSRSVDKRGGSSSDTDWRRGGANDNQRIVTMESSTSRGSGGSNSGGKKATSKPERQNSSGSGSSRAERQNSSGGNSRPERQNSGNNNGSRADRQNSNNNGGPRTDRQNSNNNGGGSRSERQNSNNSSNGSKAERQNSSGSNGKSERRQNGGKSKHSEKSQKFVSGGGSASAAVNVSTKKVVQSRRSKDTAPGKQEISNAGSRRDQHTALHQHNPSSSRSSGSTGNSHSSSTNSTQSQQLQEDQSQEHQTAKERDEHLDSIARCTKQEDLQRVSGILITRFVIQKYFDTGAPGLDWSKAKILMDNLWTRSMKDAAYRDNAVVVFRHLQDLSKDCLSITEPHEKASFGLVLLTHLQECYEDILNKSGKWSKQFCGILDILAVVYSTFPANDPSFNLRGPLGAVLKDHLAEAFKNPPSDIDWIATLIDSQFLEEKIMENENFGEWNQNAYQFLCKGEGTSEDQRKVLLFYLEWAIEKGKFSLRR